MKIFAILLIVLSCFLFQGRLFPQARNDSEILSLKVPGGDAEYLETADAFHTTLDRLALPGGLVRISTCDQKPLRQLWRPSNAPLVTVLNGLTKSDPLYGWEIRDGVINLLPVNGEPPLLTSHVDSFGVSSCPSVHDALDTLLRRPEVRAAMAKEHLQTGLTLVKRLASPKPTTFNVHFEGGTLRDALNQLAKAQGKAQWDYFEDRCDGQGRVSIRF